MKLSELPSEVQQQLAKQRNELSGKRINTAYRVELYNADGTRYFEAIRRCKSWSDDKGNYSHLVAARIGLFVTVQFNGRQEKTHLAARLTNFATASNTARVLTVLRFLRASTLKKMFWH